MWVHSMKKNRTMIYMCIVTGFQKETSGSRYGKSIVNTWILKMIIHCIGRFSMIKMGNGQEYSINDSVSYAKY